MPVVTKTVGPQTHQWAPLVSQHQRSYRIIARTITMNQWGVRSRTDVLWIDVERVGKSVIAVFSSTRLANSAICSTPGASSLSNVSSFRASTGCSTTFKCNFFHVDFSAGTFLTRLPSDPERTSVKPSSINTPNSKSKTDLRTVRPLPETMQKGGIKGPNVRNTLVRTMGAQTSTARKAASVITYHT